MTRFPNQVDDRPVIFALLQMIQGQFGQLSPLWGVTVITNLLVPDIDRCVIVGKVRSRRQGNPFRNRSLVEFVNWCDRLV